MSEEPQANRSDESLCGGGIDFSAVDDITLLRLPSLAIGEARRRGLVSTWDLPVGGYAERLAGIVYRAEPIGARGVGHDLITVDGWRIEVKAIARGKQTSPAHPEGFDAVIVVRFHPETLDVLWALEVPSCRVEAISGRHKNGGRSLRGPLRKPDWPGSIDRTEAFRAAVAEASQRGGLPG